jgi:hypothetical protein
MPSSRVADALCEEKRVEWTIVVRKPIITFMRQNTETIIKQYRKAASKLRKENKDPAKARAFLIRAGIAEKSPASPGGVRLVKELR